MSWAKTSVGLITFAFVTLTLFIVLSGPIGIIFDAIGEQTEDVGIPVLHYEDFDNTSYFYLTNFTGDGWNITPENMIDGDISTYARTAFGECIFCDYQNLTNNTYQVNGYSFYGGISHVYLRAYGTAHNATVKLKPYFDTGLSGSFSTITFTYEEDWSSWAKITGDINHPTPWTWNNISGLRVNISFCYTASNDGYCNVSKVQIYVVSDTTSVSTQLSNYKAWRRTTVNPHTDPYTNVIPILDTLRNVFGLCFVLSMIGLAVWFLLGSHKDEYEETVREDHQRWRGF